MKKSIIVGDTGQDGTYLSALLREKNYEITGISRKTSDILSHETVENLLKTVQPDEVYFLAAVHQSSSDVQVEDGELLLRSLDLNVRALIHFLEGMRKFLPSCKLFYAGSSHIFGSPEKSPQDESSPFHPDCIYGITKTAGIRACRFYRENHRLFACVGILYNHESPLRASKYVSKKIVETAVAIKLGLKTELVLGNLQSQIDWGYALDYMHAVYAMMQLPVADDFIISSGIPHTIEDFVREVFSCLKLDWIRYVKVDPLLISKKQKKNLLGNNQKIRNTTGWSPALDFKGLTRLLVQEELKKRNAG